MKLAIIASAIATSAAFAPTATYSTKSALHSTPEETADIPADIAQPTPALEVVGNGWTPDESLPCYGLPGVVAPTGYFDPLGFAQTGITLNEIKRNREAEVMHGRVAMLATVGYFAGEAIPGPFGLTGPGRFYHNMYPCVQYEVFVIWILHLNLVCLYPCTSHALTYVTISSLLSS